MNEQLKYKAFDVECCNYKYREFEVPMWNRQIFNEETCETIYLDYSFHSLLRNLQRRRHYDIDYMVEIIQNSFDFLLSQKCGTRVILQNAKADFCVIGMLYIGSLEDSYVFSIITVIALNKRVRLSQSDAVIYNTGIPSLAVNTTYTVDEV